MRLSLLLMGFCFISLPLFSQSASVHFQVDMSLQILEGNFNPASETVDIAGNFNGWGSSQHNLTDADNDSIYVITISTFNIGQTLEFKFRMNQSWDGREEFPNGGSNRSYTVQSLQDTLSVWYNDEEIETGPPVADFTVNSQTTSVGRTLYFSDLSSGRYQNVEWIFEGGSPETASTKNVAVQYESEGVFDVTLITSSESLSDTLKREAYITVTEAQDVTDPKDKPDWQNAIMYEVFVRSFFDSNADGNGDLFGLTQKLDYLEDLGVTGLWLMPISESPSYHGYDVVDYRSIEKDYGDIDDFKLLLDEAHKRGMLVIVDYVMNHSSEQHPWFEASANGDSTFREYYRWEDANPNLNGWHSRNGDYFYGYFWSGMPDLNYEHQPVKDSMFAITDYWLDDVGVDGFRLDAAIHIFEEGNQVSNVPATFDFWKDFRTYTKAINPNMFSVGEMWTDTESVLKYLDDGLDYGFEFDLCYAIVDGVKNDRASSIMSKLIQVFDLYPDNRVGTFLRNHDQPRVMNELDGDLEKSKAAAAIYLTVPGIPYLYYGEEIGMWGTKPDEDIRRPMQWSNDTNAGFTNGSPWRAPENRFTSINVEAQESDPQSLLNYYKKLIDYRKSFQPENIIPLNSDENSLLAYLVENSTDDNVLNMTIINTSEDTLSNVALAMSASYTDQFDFGCATEYLYEAFDGCSNEDNKPPFDLNDIMLLPNQAMVFSIPSAESTSNETTPFATNFELFPAYPNPFNPSTTISFSLTSSQQVNMTAYSVTGQRVSTISNAYYSAGVHQVEWNASGLASGTYFIQMRTESGSKTIKVLLVK